MTERIPCKTEGCRATILPATAAKTGGFCMPCHQWQARQKEQAYIEQHRRTVNLYEGLTDRVDILKLMHAPRRYDPLIQYVPYPLSKEELYVSLTGEEANRMLEYAVELLGADDQDTGMDILSSLVCYRNENIAGCLPILLELGVYDPAMVFKDALPELRDLLLEQVEGDDGNRNQILLGLAWIGDPIVVGRFYEWRLNPPQWTERLYVAPEIYALYAGWELTADGERRDLVHSLNYAIKLTDAPKEPAAAASAARFLTTSETGCPWCGGKLTTLMDADASHPALSYLGLPQERLQVETCERCGCFGIIYMELDGQGAPVWSRFNEEPDYLPFFDPEDSVVVPGLKPVLSSEPRSPYHASLWTLAQKDSQIGGHPSWVQDAEYPDCPCCDKRMRFIGQVDWADFNLGEGIFYMFICPEDMLTATVYQQS
ncbi:DUF1963 domain-containing protein [Paenibacillus sp. FSL R5-0527]|uniref:DUF1963 domain-containing protein n=1 Tax=Paenibacillus sp. FSL R5-0527 TaxID=2975321 RepID=UPI00097A29BC|nr:DUF1963 domain-containing protein [Paenibacillus macerans]